MKKNKLFVAGIVVAAIGAIGCIGVLINGMPDSIVGCLIFLIVGIVLIFIGLKQKDNGIAADAAENGKPITINPKPETGYSHVKMFSVAGVTFNNRQKHLKKLLDDKLRGKRLDVSMTQYDFEGRPAIDIVVNGLNIGNLHTEDTQYILQNQDRVLGIKDLYIDSFVNEDNKTVYYAKIKLIIANKNQ